MKKIKKGAILRPKKGLTLKIIEQAEGFASKANQGLFWVRVVSGTFNGFRVGEEFTFDRKTINSLL